MWKILAPVIGLAVLAVLVAGGANFDLWSAFRKKEAPAAPIEWKPEAEKAAESQPETGSVGMVRSGELDHKWSEPAPEPEPAAEKARPKPVPSHRLSGRRAAREKTCLSRSMIETHRLGPPPEEPEIEWMKRWCPEASPWENAGTGRCYEDAGCCWQAGRKTACSQPTAKDPEILSYAAASSRR